MYGYAYVLLVTSPVFSLVYLRGFEHPGVLEKKAVVLRLMLSIMPNMNDRGASFPNCLVYAYPA